MYISVRNLEGQFSVVTATMLVYRTVAKRYLGIWFYYNAKL